MTHRKTSALWAVFIALLHAWSFQLMPIRLRRANDGNWNSSPFSKGSRTAKIKWMQGEISASRGEEEHGLCLRFSSLFQRHIVYRPRRGRLSFRWNGTSSHLFCSPDDDCDDVIGSFQFLDEARNTFPHAKLVTLPEACFEITEDEIYRAVVAGGGTLECTAYNGNTTITLEEMNRSNRTVEAYNALLCLSSLAWSAEFESQPNSENGERGRAATASRLASRVGKRRFLAHSVDTIRRNYHRIMDLLTRGNSALLPAGLAFDERGARRVISSFPQLCLYDYDDVDAKVQFFLNPQPPPEMLGESTNYSAVKESAREVDWPYLFGLGYGAGLSITQVTEAVRLVPQFLAMHYEDAVKPSILHFYQNVELPYQLYDETQKTLHSYLTGATPSDVWAFSHLHSLGVAWEQIKSLLDAFPTLVVCDTEPSFELLAKGKPPVKIREDMMIYLRQRLQIGPLEIDAMVKTHSRLSGYGAKSKIKPILDKLQSRLGLSSREVRKVLFRMPSLMGMSSSSLRERLDFFLSDVGMSSSELRGALLRQPSLLQYSLESSLVPKIQFLREELCIPRAGVVRVLSEFPSIAGLSLENNLRPKVHAIVEMCRLERSEIGEIVVKVPSILASNWKRNLEPKLLFLKESLQLSSDQLSALVRKNPRTLTHSIKTSLEPKLRMIQAALDREEEPQRRDPMTASTLVVDNPALLATSTEVLKKRLEAYVQDPQMNVVDALKSKESRAEVGGVSSIHRRRKRCVLQISTDTGEILNMFPSVQAAALDVGLSVSHLYSAIRNERPVKGKRFAYGDKLAPQQAKKLFDHETSDGNERVEKHKISADVQGDQDGLGLEGALRKSRYPAQCSRREGNAIDVFVSGRAHPPDDINEVRGKSRAGGMAVYFPQVFHGGSELSSRVAQAAVNSFGLIMPSDEGGSNFSNGTILAGFPHLRPSRNRCSLYACHLAIRTILALLRGEAARTSSDVSNIKVNVYTDSDYAANLLQNSTAVLEWGSYRSVQEFQYDGHWPLSLINPDLLFPLAVSCWRIVEGVDANGVRFGRESSIEIKFHHASDLGTELSLHEHTSIGVLAEHAAVWQYNRSRTHGCWEIEKSTLLDSTTTTHKE